MDLGVQILRILCATVEEKSFSGAARKLKITQPTVSQQIARLESEIDGKIFERTSKSIHLTAIGEKLYRTAKEIVQKADQLSDDLREQKSAPQGLVRYAMPESCQWTPHYRKIMNLISEYPDIQIEIVIATNKQIQEMLMKSEIDFAFVTGDINDPETIFEKFADEHYSLVASTDLLFKPLDEKNFSEFRLVSFPGNESFLITWADTFNLLSELRHAISSPDIKVGNMIGAIHASVEGAGALVVPTHCVSNEITSGKLVVYRSAFGNQATQPIYVIKRPHEVLPRRCQIILDLLIKSKKGLL
jgi:DNA-binding transcriptional LysR family regulator